MANRGRLSTKVKLIIPFVAAITVSGTSVSRWGRGDAAAQEIQLAIEYVPNPIFHSGTPESAPAEVLERFQKKYEPIGKYEPSELGFSPSQEREQDLRSHVTR